MVWNPEQYARFARERKQPFVDLLALVERRPDMRVADLGCGSGVLTRELHQTLAAATTVGFDNSESMLASSADYAGDGVSFEQADIATLSDREFDVVFSNAALHWLPDHAGLFSRLTKLLAPGGQLVVQVPANHDHAAAVVADDVALEAGFVDVLGGYTRGAAVLDPRAYAELLYDLGYEKPVVRLNIYGHELTCVDDVVEWMKGAMLTDFERKMPADLFVRYVARYRELLIDRLGDRRPYYFTYKRILIAARR